MSDKSERNKWNRRDKQRSKRRHGHRTGSRSVFTIQQQQVERAEKVRQER